jgi:formate dehydrogenase accessory protein FdhD
MAQKAVAAGIPVFASRSIPTTAAYEMAVAKGLTMIGRIASDPPVVYTMRERVN